MEKQHEHLALINDMAAKTRDYGAIDALVAGADLTRKPKKAEGITYACIGELTRAWQAADHKAKWVAEGDIAQQVPFDPMIEEENKTPTSNGKTSVVNGILIDGRNSGQACRWLGQAGCKYEDAQPRRTQLGFKSSAVEVWQDLGHKMESRRHFPGYSPQGMMNPALVPATVIPATEAPAAETAATA